MCLDMIVSSFFNCFVSFIDHAYRMTWIYLFKTKDEILLSNEKKIKNKTKDEIHSVFKSFHMWLKNQCGAIIKLFCSDSGKEHVSVEMLSFMQDNEIRSQTRCPCTAEQKGKSHHFLLTCSLFVGSVPKYLWPAAVFAACYLINRSTKSLKFLTINL